MPNNPRGWAALDDYLDEVVSYRGYTVTRGSAFLIEDELNPDSISQQLWVGRLHNVGPEAKEHAMPTSHARELIIKDNERYHRFANFNSGL